MAAFAYSLGEFFGSKNLCGFCKSMMRGCVSLKANFDLVPFIVYNLVFFKPLNRLAATSEFNLTGINGD